MDSSNHITYFAETDSRNKRVKFGIKDDDRLRHIYSIGKTGMGKSTMLENMAIQDIQNGNGMAFIDPHGKTADLFLDYIPEHRVKDVIYFAPFDTDYPVSFNVMEDIGPEKRHLVVSGLMSAFKKLFGEESFSDRMQYILQNTILALLEYPGATMLGINRMLTDKAYRKKVVDNVTDMSVKAYWTQEFANYTERFAAEATPAIQNKVGQFTSNPLIRNIIGQPKSSFDFRSLMDDRKILIVNLSKGLVGEDNANLLGSMLITKIYLAAMSRADLDTKTLKNLPNFYIYVDEFQSFANESFADILSEARKYKLSLNITHQYIEQMAEEVRAAVFGNVGTMISFRVGSYDAEILEKEFAPVFTMEDLVNLGFVQIYLKLMIDGVASPPFSATTLPPIKPPEISFRKEVIEMSRKQFSKAKAQVEKDIIDWITPEPPPPRPDKVNTPTPINNEKPKQITPPRIESSNRSNIEIPVVNKNNIAMVKSEVRTDKPLIQNQKRFDNPAPKTEKTTTTNVLAKAIEEAMKGKHDTNPLISTNDTNIKVEIKPEVKSEIRKERISLQELRHGDKNTNKGPTLEKINALKEALEKAKNQERAKSLEIKTETINEKENINKNSEYKKKDQKEDASKLKDSSSKSSKEVPEETLRKILKG